MQNIRVKTLMDNGVALNVQKKEITIRTGEEVHGRYVSLS